MDCDYLLPSEHPLSSATDGHQVSHIILFCLQKKDATTRSLPILPEQIIEQQFLQRLSRLWSLIPQYTVEDDKYPDKNKNEVREWSDQSNRITFFWTKTVACRFTYCVLLCLTFLLSFIDRTSSHVINRFLSNHLPHTVGEELKSDYMITPPSALVMDRIAEIHRE